MEKFVQPFEYKLIYIFRIDDASHQGILKIGETTIKTSKSEDQLTPNCHDLNVAARHRIDSYTVTAGVIYNPYIYTELALKTDEEGKKHAFSDHDVHQVLLNSGIKRHYFDEKERQNEWFEVDWQTAINAIKAVKNNQISLYNNQITTTKNPIIFRPEQEECIKYTLKHFKKSKNILWNAKMRFGKTLTALEVIKEMKIKKTIIITHRPAVDEDWFDDFQKIFFEDDCEYHYGSKNIGCKNGAETLETLEKSNKPYVYFASIQDLRGCIYAGGKYDKNELIFKINWDMLIIDEAHEGTQTELGKNVRNLLVSKDTYQINLSGTPFNLFDLFSNDSTFTWDYIMEQEAKENWTKDPNKFGDSNPYGNLPKINIFAYQIEKILAKHNEKLYYLNDKAFKFTEFFRTWTGNIDKDHENMPKNVKKGDFVHEQAVNAFLDLLCQKDDETNYPFSTDEYRDYFRHTFWIVPGVKEAKALSALLYKHPVFGNGQFKIVNVAGSGDDIDGSKQIKAMSKLKKAIGKNPENTRTITLSCGRLTTGVTVPEWTAVFMLSGSYTTDAKQYLQTIFRVQSPANIDGKIKQNCYVFDFAPDRTLRVIYESIKKTNTRRKSSDSIEMLLGKFLNFCPVISFDDSKMIEFKADKLIQQIKQIYTERVINSGFEDDSLYDKEELLKLGVVDLEKFDSLKALIGKTKQTKHISDVVLADNELTEEEREKLQELKKKNKKTPEEILELKKLKKLHEQKRNAISILRGISIRIPLLVYGIDKEFDYDISIDEFTDLIKDDSWEEFMPQGITKEIFKDFIKYYDKNIFIAACKKIRNISKLCDSLEPLSRIKEITKLFNKFKNPDKETILTPWKVVNDHLSLTIGGYSFFTDDNEVDLPCYIKTKITDDVFSGNCKILEINSKTGLYALYIVYTLYMNKLSNFEREPSFEIKQKIWDEIVGNNIYVITKTSMARMIVIRTLVGYRKVRVNVHSFDDINMQIKNKQNQLVDNLKKSVFWSKGVNEKMKFNAVVGNPPYQEENSSNNRKPPIYHYFYDLAFKLSDIVTLISPARFLFNGGQTPANWNEKMLNDEHFKVIKYYSDCKDVFPTTEIKGGVAITLRNANENYGKIGIFTTNELTSEIIRKVKLSNFKPLSSIVFPKSSFTFSKDFYQLNPLLKGRLSKGGNKNNENILDVKIFSIMPEIFFEDASHKKEYVLIYGRPDNVRKSMYIEKRFLEQIPLLNNYKVIISGVNGSGKMGEVLSAPFVAEPNSGFTQTFMAIGSFTSFDNANNCLKYIKTKFARFLLGTLKVTHNNPKKTWNNIPIQNFTSFSDIDWDCEIADIDKQLFKKYNLSEDMINYINTECESMK